MDADALASLRRLLDTRPVAALGTLHRGEPAVSMVPFVLAADVGLVVHVSALATHTRDMLDHPRVGVLVMAEPRGGVPPQALPRVSLQCHAQPLLREGIAHAQARSRYLARFPDAAQTFELGDFSLFALRPVSARLVAGFGQASSLVGEALERWLLAVTLRLLQGEAGDMAQLQRVIEAAPDYVQRVTGLPPGPADSQSTYTMLPEGKGYEDKFVYGIYRGDEMVGCVDLIRGWPDARTAHLGLLLVAEPFQRQGVGAAALRLVEEEVLRWGTCTTIRLGVVATNAQALPFWQRQGFVETGEVKPYRYGSVESEVVVLAKRLDAVPVGGNAT